jgi:hypothetical protein
MGYWREKFTVVKGGKSFKGAFYLKKARNSALRFNFSGSGSFYENGS